ncbi:hypothetical protein JL804_00010 [Staphylococcus pseudintermedius]|nr:hypothetical protein [Staphylococcus pseudintermedius]MCE5607489.1 hypothetical protein [Staphylococcus pseudintermedius]MCE5614149.1 hypothetical protein [Staphylococcus pseudintermedius]MCE5706687.1 hypothetical protein [Staphylococcus pseudintermedius]MCE5723598.1 hypothetical protein [Staphylococcus pseudintermedius]
MRFSNRVMLVTKRRKQYDPDTNQYKRETVTHETLVCNINPLSPTRTSLLFGDVYKAINVIRLNTVVDYEPTHALIDGVCYAIKKRVESRRQTAFYVEEVVLSRIT